MSVSKAANDAAASRLAGLSLTVTSLEGVSVGCGVSFGCEGDAVTSLGVDDSVTSSGHSPLLGDASSRRLVDSALRGDFSTRRLDVHFVRLDDFGRFLETLAPPVFPLPPQTSCRSFPLSCRHKLQLSKHKFCKTFQTLIRT